MVKLQEKGKSLAFSAWQRNTTHTLVPMWQTFEAGESAELKCHQLSSFPHLRQTMISHDTNPLLQQSPLQHLQFYGKDAKGTDPSVLKEEVPTSQTNFPSECQEDILLTLWQLLV